MDPKIVFPMATTDEVMIDDFVSFSGLKKCYPSTVFLYIMNVIFHTVNWE